LRALRPGRGRGCCGGPITRARACLDHGTSVVRLSAMSTGYALDHDSTKTGRWLRQRRLRTALWIAVVEAVLAAFTHDVSRVTIIVLAAIFVPIYLIWGRNQGDTIRQLTWIAAASQALAVVAAVLAIVIGLLVLVIAGIFAAVALFLIFTDRR